MARSIPSRREFLKTSSAVLASGSALAALGSRTLAADVPTPATSAPQGLNFRQGVASSRQEAGEAARDVLRQGGNAIDAAAAALLVQCVIEPSNVSIGGYGGSIAFYQAKTGAVHAVDFDSHAPQKFDPAHFTEENANYGYLAVGSPGVIGGIDVALREFGTLPFKTLAQHAIAQAENGITVTPRLARAFAGLLQRIDPVSRRAYFPNGVPEEGTAWVQRDYANLLRRLGEEGPGSFYIGEIARTIVKQVQENGGVLSEEDLREFHARVVEPLHITYRGYDLYTPPLPSAGLTSLTILKTLEQFDLSRLTPWGADYIELFAGASNLAWGERFKYFGDPDFVKVPVEELLSEKAAAARAEILRKGTPTVTPQPTEPSHTVNIVVVDKDQNVASWTATHGGDFGSHVAIEGLGLMLGHGMSRFAFKGPAPNYPAPGKRPQHNMAPLLVLHNDRPYAGLGLPGGRKIVTVTAQLAVNLIDFKGSPQQVVSAPRIHTEGTEPIQVTSDTPPEIVEEVRRKGHQVRVVEALGSDSNAVVIDQATGAVQPAASVGSTGVLVF